MTLTAGSLLCASSRSCGHLGVEASSHVGSNRIMFQHGYGVKSRYSAEHLRSREFCIPLKCGIIIVKGTGGNPSMVGAITAASTDVPNAYVTGSWLKTHLPLRAKGTAVAAIDGWARPYTRSQSSISTITKMYNRFLTHSQMIIAGPCASGLQVARHHHFQQRCNQCM